MLLKKPGSQSGRVGVPVPNAARGKVALHDNNSEGFVAAGRLLSWTLGIQSQSETKTSVKQSGPNLLNPLHSAGKLFEVDDYRDCES